jgi:hypothetical protein
VELRVGVGKDVGLALRGGYSGERAADGLNGVTAGAGFAMGGLTVDYALVTMGDVDPNHRVSVGYRF